VEWEGRNSQCLNSTLDRRKRREISSTMTTIVGEK
jgi:hypothetical protein